MLEVLASLITDGVIEPWSVVISIIKFSDFVSDVFFILELSKFEREDHIFFLMFIFAITFTSIGVLLEVKKFMVIFFLKVDTSEIDGLGDQHFSVQDMRKGRGVEVLRLCVVHAQKIRAISKIMLLCSFCEDIPQIIIGITFLVYGNLKNIDVKEQEYIISAVSIALSTCVICLSICYQTFLLKHSLPKARQLVENSDEYKEAAEAVRKRQQERDRLAIIRWAEEIQSKKREREREETEREKAEIHELARNYLQEYESDPKYSDYWLKNFRSPYDRKERIKVIIRWIEKNNEIREKNNEIRAKKELEAINKLYNLNLSYYRMNQC
jgi:hypothetical protein